MNRSKIQTDSYLRAGCGFTLPPEKHRATFPAVRTVLVWNHEDSLHSLWRGTSAERQGVWRALEGAVQVLEVRKDYNRENQTANGCHGGDDATSLLRPRQCH